MNMYVLLNISMHISIDINISLGVTNYIITWCYLCNYLFIVILGINIYNIIISDKILIN